MSAVTAMSRILAVCLAVASPTAVAGSSDTAECLVNGDFEAGAAGAFDSWRSAPGLGAASASAGPCAIGGNRSARLLAHGGFLLQTVSTDGIRHFAMEMDFAALVVCDSVWFASDAQSGVIIALFTFAMLMLAVMPMLTQHMTRAEPLPVVVEAPDPHPPDDPLMGRLTL